MPVPCSGAKAQLLRSSSVLLWRVLEFALSDSKLLALRPLCGAAPPLGVDRKLMVLPRRDKPVEDRFFFFWSKSFSFGRLPFGVDLGPGLVWLGSSGDPGDGGVFDRVVAAERVNENRRGGLVLFMLAGGGPLPTGAVFRLEASWLEGVWRKVVPLPLLVGFEVGGGACSVTCWLAVVMLEFERRKREDIVRLKLVVELRVDRRERGVLSGSTSVGVAAGSCGFAGLQTAWSVGWRDGRGVFWGETGWEFGLGRE